MKGEGWKTDKEVRKEEGRKEGEVGGRDRRREEAKESKR